MGFVDSQELAKFTLVTLGLVLSPNKAFYFFRFFSTFAHTPTLIFFTISHFSIVTLYPARFFLCHGYIFLFGGKTYPRGTRFPVQNHAVGRSFFFAFFKFLHYFLFLIFCYIIFCRTRFPARVLIFSVRRRPPYCFLVNILYSPPRVSIL